MRLLRIWWAQWRLKCAEDELAEFQDRFDVQPLYLVTTRIHINYLRAHIAALKEPRRSRNAQVA
jgi:hypothetical protein